MQINTKESYCCSFTNVDVVFILTFTSNIYQAAHIQQQLPLLPSHTHFWMIADIIFTCRWRQKHIVLLSSVEKHLFTLLENVSTNSQTLTSQPRV